MGGSGAQAAVAFGLGVKITGGVGGGDGGRRQASQEEGWRPQTENP